MPTSRDTHCELHRDVPRGTESDAGHATDGDTAAAATTSLGEVTIDCDCCAQRDTAACDDCVVTFLLGRDPDDAVVIDADEARAMRMLERAGLVPTLRFSSSAG